MHQYKLTYVNLAGAAEPIRWIFKIAGVEFEDERIELEDFRKSHKFSGRFPLQQVPMLEIDGKVFTQSTAILRYLAKKFGLVTNNELLDLAVEMAHQIVMDGFVETQKFFWETEQERRAKQHNFMIHTWLPLGCTQLTKILEENVGNFIAGSKLTYADLSLANWFNIWTALVDPELPTKHPRLTEHQQAVFEIAEIKAWLNIRPQTWC